MLNRFFSAAALVAATTLLMPLAASAQTVVISSDNAGNYGGPSQPTFSDGANAGTGFKPFVLTNGGNSGFFMYTSNANGDGSGPGIDSPNLTNSNNYSFGEYANNGDTASATRQFNSPLSAGQTFSGGFDNGYVANGSYDDFAVGNSSGLLYQFTFAGGDTNYFFNGTNTGIGFTNGGLALSFALTDATHYSFTATSLANATQTFTQTGVLAGTIDRVNIANHNAGTTGADLYFNNLSIVGPAAAPEPSGMVSLLIGMAVVGGLVASRRRTASLS